jgi:5'(3')-deoxyribonucleotidase
MSENSTWDFASWGISPKEDATIWNQINYTKNFWEHVGKMKGTENLKDAALDYQLYFITNRAATLGRSIEEQSCNWLVNNYDIKFPQVIVCKEKGLIAKGLELFSFIDDKPENCKMVQEGAPTCKHSTYIRDHLYNRGECGCKFIRVPTLDTFLERLP